MHQVVHGVHRVGEWHRVERGTSECRALATIHRRHVGGIPCSVLGVVVANGQLVAVVDVPVHACQQLQVALVGREVGKGTSVVAVLLLGKLLHTLHVGHGGVGEVLLLAALTVYRRSPAYSYRGRSLVLGIGEEEELVLDDGAAECGTVSSASVAVACTGDGLSVNYITTHVLVVVVYVGSTLELVGTRLGNGIHTTADEVGLANVEGRDNNLKFLDSINRDGAATAGETIAKTKVVVEVGTVHGEVCGTAVHTGKVHSVAAIGRQTCDVCDAAADGGHRLQLCIADVGGCTGLLASKL